MYLMMLIGHPYGGGGGGGGGGMEGLDKFSKNDVAK